MLTKREEQILSYIEQRPDITQDDLARLCGITRSSIAVHISNLMKKGVIAGRGYIVRNNPYILVVGGQNMDISGLPAVEPMPDESTPGTVRVSEGGMGRNIAANLALMGEEVKLITVFGNDALAERLAESSRRLGIDTSHSLTVNAATSIYLLITTVKGKTNFSICDTEIFEQMSPRVLAERQKVIQGAGLVIADTNLPRDALHWLAENCRVPLFLRTISRFKVHKVQGILHRIHTLALSLPEAEDLSGIVIACEEDMQKAARYFLEKGTKRVFFLRGKEGVYAVDKNQIVMRGGMEVNAENAMGTSGSFVAALALAWRQGLSLEQSTRMGAAAAVICMQVGESVNHRMSLDSLQQTMQDLSPGKMKKMKPSNANQ